jgi:hypothetical protein
MHVFGISLFLFQRKFGSQKPSNSMGGCLRGCRRLRVELVELIVLFDYDGTAGARDKPGEETEPGTER